MRGKIFILLLIFFVLPFTTHAQEEEEKDKNIKYSSSTSFSALMTSGNTQDFSLSVETDQKFSLYEHEFNFKGNIIYALSDGEKKSEIYSSLLKYNWQINSKLYLLGLTKFDRNVFSGYNYRFAFSGGFGYSFLSKEKIKISADIALGWSTENNAQKIAQEIMEKQINTVDTINVSPSFFSSIISSYLIYQVSPNTQLENQGASFINLEDWAAYRLTSYTSLTVAINNNFSLKTSFQINYENMPVPGYKPVDMFLLSSIMFKI